MVGRVRTPMDEYQMAQARNKSLQAKTSNDPMQAADSKAPDTMPVATQAGRTEGKPVKMKSDSPNVRKKVKGYSSEIM